MNQGGWGGMGGGMTGPGMPSSSNNSNSNAMGGMHNNSMPGIGMGMAPQGAGGLGGNPAMPGVTGLQNMTPAMQLLYQQYALRWAAMQKVAGMAGMGALGGGMMGMGMGNQGGIAGNMPPMGQQGPPGGGMPGIFGSGRGQGPGPRRDMRDSGPPGPAGPPRQEDPTVFYKTRICNKWREGQCPFPESCKYAHGDQELRTVEQNIAEGAAPAGRPQGSPHRPHLGEPSGIRGPPPQGPPHRQEPMGQDRRMDRPMQKHRLCHQFMETGVCRYGDRCSFAHGHKELQAGPQGAQQGMQQQGPPGRQLDLVPLDPQAKVAMKKTRLCDRFMQTGACGYGDRCTFAHGHHELRARPPPPPGGSSAAAPSKPSALPSSAETQPQDGSHTPVSTGPAVTSSDGPDARASEDAADAAHSEDGSLAAVAGGAKRARSEGAEEGEGPQDTGVQSLPSSSKRVHVAEEAVPAAPECELCAKLMRQGRNQVLAALNKIDNKQAQKLGCLILAAAGPKLEQLWSKCTPAMVLNWLGKTEGLTIVDRIDVLQAVVFHTHITNEEGRTLAGGLSLDSQRYIDMGLPPDCADFLYVVMYGREGEAAMSEYFHMLEVAKQLFGISNTTGDETYYSKSTTIANIMMGE